MNIHASIERRLRERSIRECGKVRIDDLHDQRIDEILRNRENEIRREKVRKTSARLSNSRPDEDEDGLSRLWSKAKGFASNKKKSSLPVRYSKSKDDEVELLKVNGSDNESSSSSPWKQNSTHRSGSSPRYTSKSSGNLPKKGIFDDI